MGRLAVELAATTDDALGNSVDEIERAAKSHGLAVVPATIDSSGITLDSKLNASDVVELAASVNAGLMYLDRGLAEAAPIVTSIRDNDIAPTDKQACKTLLTALQNINGFTCRIDLGFAHAGITHTWTFEAPWFDDFEEIAITIETAESETPDSSAEEEADSALAEALASDPAFRRGRTRTEYEAAALALPAVAALRDTDRVWKTHSIIQRAQSLLQQQSFALVDEMEDRLAELAASLASTDEFRSAGTAEGRRKAAQKWLMACHTNGLRMPRALIGELAAAAGRHPGPQLGLL